ncbi:MAG TPA: CvpA family protein [Caulobacteraceae bacterium]|nr:CvpA family protein [Caulobacteraceae bacterium]
MTLFDLIALLILGVSILVGLLRGALREVATVVAFVAAVAIAIFALRFTGPIARASVHPAWAATAAALLVVFLAAYIALRVAAGGLMRGVHNIKALGLIDRIAGGGFGLVRGLVALGLFYLVFNLAPPPTGTPAWIADAKLYPLAKACADGLRALAPRGSAFAGKLTPAIANAVRDGGNASDSGQSSQSGYKGAPEP